MLIRSSVLFKESVCAFHNLLILQIHTDTIMAEQIEKCECRRSKFLKIYRIHPFYRQHFEARLFDFFGEDFIKATFGTNEQLFIYGDDVAYLCNMDYKYRLLFGHIDVLLFNCHTPRLVYLHPASTSRDKIKCFIHEMKYSNLDKYVKCTENANDLYLDLNTHLVWSTDCRCHFTSSWLQSLRDLTLGKRIVTFWRHLTYEPGSKHFNELVKKYDYNKCFEIKTYSI